MKRIDTEISIAISRRRLLQSLTTAAVGAPFAATAFGQGRCRDGFETQGCPLPVDRATAPIAPVFAATGWKTVALDHIAYRMADPQKEAAFYVALMGWKVRSDDGSQVVMDIGNWGSAIFKKDAAQKTTVVDRFCFAIEPWNGKTVEAELRKRGLEPIADNAGSFESFHVKDPDGWDVQIANGSGLVKARKTPATANLAAPAPFESTGWKTVWLDHFSFGATDYKRSASFYMNLLGWQPTYDEGSQHELMMGQVGDIIIRGGNPNDPNFGKAPARGSGDRGRIDHISFGITPWDTDGVKAELETRGLQARVDTSTRDDIHVALFKSYHTFTPNGYNLQISYVTHENRLALPTAVKPKVLTR